MYDGTVMDVVAVADVDAVPEDLETRRNEERAQREFPTSGQEPIVSMNSDTSAHSARRDSIMRLPSVLVNTSTRMSRP